MANVNVENNSYTVDTLYQWDLNQVLEIYGLSFPSAPEIHFTNDAMVRAVRRFATMDAAGVIRAEVPNAMLQTTATIKALVCIRDGEVFKTYHEIRIPVKARQRPADYTITDDDDIYSFLALENLVYENVDKIEAGVTVANQAMEAATNAQNVANSAAETAAGIAKTAANAQTIATNAQNVANAKATVVKIASALTANWIGAAAPYTQTVTIDGILEADTPHISPVYSDTLETAIAQKEAWSLVSKAVTGDGVIVFSCFEDVPSVEIPIMVEVIR